MDEAARVEAFEACSFPLGGTYTFLFSVPPIVHPIPQLAQRTRTLIFPARHAHPPRPENRMLIPSIGFDDEILGALPPRIVSLRGVPSARRDLSPDTWAPYLQSRSTSGSRPFSVQFFLYINW